MIGCTLGRLFPKALVGGATVSFSKKRHTCHFCSKAFPGKAKLYMHIKTHTREKDFICPVCKKGFSRKDSMRIHVWNIHSEAARSLKGQI